MIHVKSFISMELSVTNTDVLMHGRTANGNANGVDRNSNLSKGIRIVARKIVRRRTMAKYCVRLKDAKFMRDFLCVVGENDPDFEMDPEGNPVTVWITTTLSEYFLRNLEVVEDVVVAT